MLEKLLDRFREKGPSRPRSRTEAERTRRLLIVLVIVVAVVSAVSIVGYGYYDTNIRPWNQRILKVNGTVIDMRTFVHALRLQQGYSNYYSSRIEWAQSVAAGLEQDELARQRLAGFDVDVKDVTSSEAVDAKLREELVSAGMISEDATDDEFKEACEEAGKGLKKNVGVSLERYKELMIEPQLVSEELQRLVGDREYASTDNFEHAQVQALLVSGADDAAQLRARWEAGEAFDTLVKEKAVSESLRDTDSDNASVVKWVAKGTKSDAFDDFVFRAAYGVLSDPIQDSYSTGSYWLIRAISRESRALSDSDREALVSDAYSKWLEEISESESNDIVYYLEKKGGTAKLSWALDHVAV